MAKTITATEAVRKFSEILNSIKYNGKNYTILRGGKPVASISPFDTHDKDRTLGELKELLRKFSWLGDEAKKFERDVNEIINHQPSLPEESRWD
jgi:antitoxin (DNA-binding transcriptional repressor) of toxin-antitoxin stability system